MILSAPCRSNPKIRNTEREALRSTPPRRNRAIITRATWLDSKGVVEVDLPLERCWKMWQRREEIPQWMPWIQAVEVDKKDNDVSRWLLSTEALGQKFEFSWKARNLPPLKNKMIHWKSVRNKGAVRFRRVDEEKCEVQLVISFEVPDLLSPIAEQVTPIVDSILQADMDRFRQKALAGELKEFDEMR
eukprot:jgi/Bigna1/45356/e_gw1.119.11.1